MADDRIETGTGASSRRTLLKLGAMAVPAVVTLKPAMAQAEASLAMCRIPIDREIDKDGKLLSPGYTASSMGGKRAYPPPSKGYYLGQELIDYQQTGTLPDGVYSKEQFEAHIKYIKTLRPGDDGFTCLTSIVHRT